MLLRSSVAALNACYGWEVGMLWLAWPVSGGGGGHLASLLFHGEGSSKGRVRSGGLLTPRCPCIICA